MTLLQAELKARVEQRANEMIAAGGSGAVVATGASLPRVAEESPSSSPMHRVPSETQLTGHPEHVSTDNDVADDTPDEEVVEQE